MAQLYSIVNRFFTTTDGSVVVAQIPNVPLIAFLGFWTITLFDTPLNSLAYWMASVSLLYWAYLEVTSGVNLFRKALGLVVFLYLFVTRLYQVFYI